MPFCLRVKIKELVFVIKLSTGVTNLGCTIPTYLPSLVTTFNHLQLLLKYVSTGIFTCLKRQAENLSKIVNSVINQNYNISKPKISKIQR